MSFFFAALLAGDASRLIPSHRHLDHRLIRLQSLSLSFDLVGNGVTHAAKGIQVLDLYLGAELVSAWRAQREVHFTAHRAFLHIAAAHPQITNNLAQASDVCIGLLRRVHIGLRYDLHQGHTGPVDVDQTVITHVCQLAGILLQVHPADPDAPGLITHINVQVSTNTQRQLVLRDLVTLGQVGVEVVLAGKEVVRLNRTVQRQTSHHSVPNGVFVDGWQGPRHAQADWTYVRVWRGTEGVGTASTEHLTGGVQLHVDFHPNDGLVRH